MTVEVHIAYHQVILLRSFKKCREQDQTVFLISLSLHTYTGILTILPNLLCILVKINVPICCDLTSKILRVNLSPL